MSTACTCQWERWEIPGLQPILLRSVAYIFCIFPGHAEEARDG